VARRNKIRLKEKAAVEMGVWEGVEGVGSDGVGEGGIAQLFHAVTTVEELPSSSDIGGPPIY
jgi:hypothetical protein